MSVPEPYITFFRQATSTVLSYAYAGGLCVALRARWVGRHLRPGLLAERPSSALLNPNVGEISGTFFNSDAYYHALEVQFMKRMSHGLQIQASYTWARAIDTSSGTTDPDQFTNGLGDNFFFNSAIRRGPSDFNVDQNLSINYDWVLPHPRSISGLLAWPLSGWELGGIVTVQGGVPFTPSSVATCSARLATAAWTSRSGWATGCQTAVNPQNADNYIKLQCFGFRTLPPCFRAAGM